MMMMLRDDLMIELFDDPSSPPSWIEGVDVEGKEYAFCDVSGQRYEGRIIEPGTLLRQPRFQLEAVGSADRAHALSLVKRLLALRRTAILTIWIP